jgi:hypothetical protein
MKNNKTTRVNDIGSCRGIKLIVRDTPREDDNLIQVRFERSDEVLQGSHFEMFLSPADFCDLFEPIRDSYFNIKYRYYDDITKEIREQIEKQKQLDFWTADDKNDVITSLEMNISDNVEFKRWIREDESRAQHLYHTLCNNDFVHKETGKMWSCSWRYAGGLVADVLCRGDYLNWYCSGNEGAVDEQIAEWFEKMGWAVHEDIEEGYTG